MSHLIKRLQIHAQLMCVIYMRNSAGVEEIEEAAGRISMLMAFFDLNCNEHKHVNICIMKFQFIIRSLMA